MMNRLVLAVAWVVAVLLYAGNSDGQWTHLTYYAPSSDAMCTAEWDYSGGAQSCWIDTNWTDQYGYPASIGTSHNGNTAYASVSCEIFVQTCYGSPDLGDGPALIYSYSQNGSSHKAVCKSDAGAFQFNC